MNEKKSVFITGGSRGIGAACVKKFAKEEYEVAFIYKDNSEAASRTLSDAEALSDKGSVISIPVDLSKSDAWENLKTAVKNAKVFFGIRAFDVAVLNAGITGMGLATDIKPEEIEEVSATNLRGTILSAKSVLPDMISEKRGAIILISSVWGRYGASMESIYAATKAGIIGFGKSLASEVGPSGIRVNTVAPGVIDTDMSKILSKETLRLVVEETPLGRIGLPEEVASLTYFLASEEASFITGQVVGIDGGFRL